MAHYLVSSHRDLLALELYPMGARALAARFGRDVLADIQATVPLDRRRRCEWLRC